MGKPGQRHTTEQACHDQNNSDKTCQGDATQDQADRPDATPRFVDEYSPAPGPADAVASWSGAGSTGRRQCHQTIGTCKFAVRK